MKEILVVVGSAQPQGNTNLLAQAFAEGATQAGHRVETVLLGQQKIGGCLGCNACRQGKPCVQKDGMQPLYAALERADMVVLASPLYYWTISSSLKAFIERLYAISQPDANPPLGRYEKYPQKDCALLMTAADNFFWTFEQATAYYQLAICNYLGWQNRGMVLAGGCGGVSGPRKIAQTQWLEKAFALGKSI